MKRKLLSVLLVLVMAISLFPLSALAAGYSDTDGHWAEGEVSKWSDAGILTGSEGSFRPNDSITRAEMATIFDRIMAYHTKAENKFADLDKAWYTDAILRANAAGLMLGGDGLVRPNDKITRQEAAILICRAMGIPEKAGSTSFADDASIASWAKGYVNALASADLIAGVGDNRFAPTDSINRASVVKMLDNAIKGFYQKAGEYTGDVQGNAVVNAPNVILKNMKISGNLIIAEGVGDGDVQLDNVKVEGKLIVRGGGVNSIRITGSSQISSVIIQKTDDGGIRVVTEGGAVIEAVFVDDGKDDVILTGSFKAVTVAADVPVSAVSANIGSVNVTGAGASLTVDSASKIAAVSVAETAVNTEISVKGEVGTLTANAAITVDNQGTIKKADVKADNVIIDGNKPNDVKVDDSVKEPPKSSDGKPVEGGGTSGGGGGGGGVPSTVAVSAISVTPKKMTLYAEGATGTITATIAPTNATNKNVTWTTSDDKVATVTNGVVTPVAAGTATVTATSAADSSKTATCTVTVKKPITGTFNSTNNVGIAPDTAGDAAGKIYAEYKLVTDKEDISLAEGNVDYIKVKIGEGEWDELTANTDATLWFNVEAATGMRSYEVKTKDGDVYTATLDWDKNIKTATWVATAKEGVHESKTYVEYKMMDGTAQVSLKVDNVKLIASKDADGKWVALEPNTDETLWFNKAKATGNYEFFVVTKDNGMYKATLDWQGEDVYAALAAVNAYLTSENYVYANAPEALEKHLTKLGINVGDGSNYAELQTENYNRKTAVFYDLNNNKPSKGYDLGILTTYFNDMVATRLVTQASMDKVNNAENFGALDGISYVTMLLNQFELVTYGTHSDIPVAEKISTLQGLVDRYNALSEANQKAALQEVLDKKPTDGYSRSQATTDALAVALTKVENDQAAIDARLAITSVTIADNRAYASTGAGEDKTVRVLGYGVGIDLDAKTENKKISNTTSIVIKLYKGETLLGQQTFNATGYSKNKEASRTSGTIDAGGQYKATSWDNIWSAKINEIPDKVVAIVQYTDGTATAEKNLDFTAEQTKIFYAAEAVHALFVDPFAETLVLATGVTQDAINTAQTLVNEVTLNPNENKAVLEGLIIKASELLNSGQGDGGK